MSRKKLKRKQCIIISFYLNLNSFCGRFCFLLSLPSLSYRVFMRYWLDSARARRWGSRDEKFISSTTPTQTKKAQKIVFMKKGDHCNMLNLIVFCKETLHCKKKNQRIISLQDMLPFLRLKDLLYTSKNYAFLDFKSFLRLHTLLQRISSEVVKGTVIVRKDER